MAAADGTRTARISAANSAISPTALAEASGSVREQAFTCLPANCLRSRPQEPAALTHTRRPIAHVFQAQAIGSCDRRALAAGIRCAHEATDEGRPHDRARV